MVNMNKHEDPCIYGLTSQDGRVFYIGLTKKNALNRWWEHRYRARTGHRAPVYQKMRSLGVDSVGYVVIESLSEIPQDQWLLREAALISDYTNRGFELVNDVGRDGRPNSMSERSKAILSEGRRGKPTWIKGKRGDEAGWTAERRARQAETLRLRREQHQ